MSHPWRCWVVLWTRRERGESLALMRILAGLALLLNVGGVWAGGILDLVWVDVADGGYRHLGDGGARLAWLGGPTRPVIHAVAALALASGVGLVLGWRSRLWALLGGQSLMALAALNPHTKGSYDSLHSNILWLLVLARSDATWSLACRLRTGRWSSALQVPAWPRTLGAVQLAAVYFFTALHKLSAYWMPAGGYAALYFILQQPSWHRWDMSFLAHAFWLTQAITAAVWWWELTFPVALLWLALRARWRTCGGGWRPGMGRLARALLAVDLRRVYALFGLALHAGIWVLLEVGPFSLIIAALYPCLVHPRELRAFFARHRVLRKLTSA